MEKKFEQISDVAKYSFSVHVMWWIIPPVRCLNIALLFSFSWSFILFHYYYYYVLPSQIAEDKIKGCN